MNHVSECPHCHEQIHRSRESAGKDDHGKVVYRLVKIKQCPLCGAQMNRWVEERVMPQGQQQIGGLD